MLLWLGSEFPVVRGETNAVEGTWAKETLMGLQRISTAKMPMGGIHKGEYSGPSCFQAAVLDREAPTGHGNALPAPY